MALTGVPQTLLWTLNVRATWAARRRPLLIDPLAIELRNAIDYPYRRHFGPPIQAAALRAVRFDREVRLFLDHHPDGTVVSLGEGLGTGFWRNDNGRVRWLSVDLSEVVELRARYLPQHDRHRNLACSALDLRWMDEVDRERGVLVMAEGLLMYLERADVERLIAACAARFPGGTMIFDVIPRWLSAKTQSEEGWWLSKEYQTPAMPFGINVSELSWFRGIHPNIAGVEDMGFGRGCGFAFGFLFPLLGVLPLPAWLDDKRPALLQLRFGGG